MLQNRDTSHKYRPDQSRHDQSYSQQATIADESNDYQNNHQNSACNVPDTPEPIFHAQPRPNEHQPFNYSAPQPMNNQRRPVPPVPMPRGTSPGQNRSQYNEYTMQ